MSIGEISWMPPNKRDVEEFDVYKLTTVEDFNKVLDELIKQVQGLQIAYGINVTNSRGDNLVMVIGLPNQTFLSYTKANNAPPYYISLGEEESENEVIPYLWSGSYSEVEPHNLITLYMGREVAKHFLMTGSLSNIIRWEEV